MKKHLRKLALLSVIIAAFSITASAQVYVSIRPVVPVFVHSAPPSPAHVWIGEDWQWRGGQYVHVGGRWVYPPHPGYEWAPGYWGHRRGGWQWFPGRWRGRGRR